MTHRKKGGIEMNIIEKPVVLKAVQFFDNNDKLTERRENMDRKIENILDKHKKWVYLKEGGERADLRNAELKDANLMGMHLEYAELKDAKLIGTNLGNAYLTHADLTNADLSCADLTNANLTYADLTNACFSQANTAKINGFYSVDNIGTFKGKVTYCKQNKTVYAGCWLGNLSDFLEVGLEKNVGNDVELENILMCYEFFKRMEES